MRDVGIKISRQAVNWQLKKMAKLARNETIQGENVIKDGYPPLTIECQGSIFSQVA